MFPADRVVAPLLGLAVGDAVGTAVEFRDRGSFEPLTDMVGGGPFHLKPGQWTDDTAMALCLGESLLECGGFDATDQMSRYLRWLLHGHNSCTGECFDVGKTVRAAVLRFRETGDPWAGLTRPDTAGNGCIMRLAPVVMFYHADPMAAVHHAAESSRTTHGAPECLDACRLLATVLLRCIAGADKDAALDGPFPLAEPTDFLASIAAGDYRTKPVDEIRGTGHVAACLEAALWCFATTDSFADAVLAAANLGDDADTTAAVCGQVAGAYHGVSGIPGAWLMKLAMRDEITEMARDLAGWS